MLIKLMEGLHLTADIQMTRGIAKLKLVFPR